MFPRIGWRWTAALAAAGLLAAPWAAAAGREAPRVCAILSQDAAPYLEALEGFRGALRQAAPQATVEMVQADGEVSRAEEAAGRCRAEGTSLILTLGTLATQAAARRVSDLPIVAGLVLSPEDLGRGGNVTGVVLEFPVETELRWLQRLLPGQKKIGVLFNAPGNSDRIASATRAARALGLTLNARRLDSPRDLPIALDALAADMDVLWGVADQIVLNPQTARPILLFSLRHRIPFVGLSETWVKAGALYALDRDYADIGAQCGEVAARLLQGASPASVPPATPRRVVYSINLKTARLLRIDLPPNLVQGAQAVIE
ncbi:MAG: ABC transporter substrate-binding protein [Candidatus Polarisedimenticolia bacterium]